MTYETQEEPARDETHVEQHGDGDVVIEQPDNGDEGNGEQQDQGQQEGSEGGDGDS